MPSLTELYKSAKSKLINRKRRKSNNSSTSTSGGSSTNSKSVRFSPTSESIYYTHSSLEYDRRSSTSNNWDNSLYQNEGDSLKQHSGISDEDELEPIQFDEEVVRNTKVNKKQGHYSIAALVSYRSNI
jgi:hypothetical protein